ncbi:MAG: hydrogenase-1 expression HyaE [Rhodobiaceae bacterium]|nr:hydrogenase accessory protein [Paracoccaceae bacterium]MCB1473219.1 hydrogenase-1 expression HyaE [Rhodobiaceae bacterium]
MHSPLLQSIIARHDYPLIGEDDLEAFASTHEHVVLFFAGDADRLTESNDVAVVLPELLGVFGEVLFPAVVRRDDERALQRRFRFNAYPALVFLRGGEYLGTIQRIRDWSDYLREIPEILGREPSDPPPFRLPDGCAVPAAGEAN